MADRGYVVAYRHPSEFGGMGVAADTFIPWLREIWSDVEEVNLSAPGRPLSNMGKWALSSFPHAIKLLLRACGTVITMRPSMCYFAISQSGPALIRDIAILLVYRIGRVPCVIHLHGSLLPGRLQRPLAGYLLRHLLPRRIWIVLASDIAELFPSGWSTSVVPNPLPAGVKARPLGRRGKGSTLKIGSLGLICQEKGVDLLLSACRDVSGVELTLAGTWGALPTETWTATYVGQLDRVLAF